MKKNILLLLLLLLSCKEKTRYTKIINNNERFEYFKTNIDTVYSKKIEKLINDTINKWINEDIEYYSFNIKIDDIINISKTSKYIFFNSKKDKLVARVPRQVISKRSVMDHIYTIIGQKIDSVWWFYDGETYAILREWYTKEIHKPIPFEKLEEIGINETMSWYYYEKDTTFCNLVNHSDSINNQHNCIKRILIINDYYFNSINWECTHEDYIDYFYEKKYKGSYNDTTEL